MVIELLMEGQFQLSYRRSVLRKMLPFSDQCHNEDRFSWKFVADQILLELYAVYVEQSNIYDLLSQYYSRSISIKNTCREIYYCSQVLIGDGTQVFCFPNTLHGFSNVDRYTLLEGRFSCESLSATKSCRQEIREAFF